MFGYVSGNAEKKRITWYLFSVCASRIPMPSHRKDAQLACTLEGVIYFKVQVHCLHGASERASKRERERGRESIHSVRRLCILVVCLHGCSQDAQRFELERVILFKVNAESLHAELHVENREQNTLSIEKLQPWQSEGDGGLSHCNWGLTSIAKRQHAQRGPPSRLPYQR